MMDSDAIEALRDWLLDHEEDIAQSINDYGQLAEPFLQIVGRQAGDYLDVNYLKGEHAFRR